MTIVRQKPLKTLVQPSETLPETQNEAERMRDVLLLIQNLINSEEATVKLILDCLYDVGSVNLINQKIRLRPLNRVMKLIARMSKPVFRVLAFDWFKKNCPKLITDWLHLQITFKGLQNIPQEIAQEIAIEAEQLQPYSLSQTESLSLEIKHLRYQVRWLTGISIVAIACLGITLTYLN
ncbi:hypothetical protein [Nostoc sp. MG11]|uniref:hypothetical protein n=1 Tax=Nostoc sp. MG11 TaxID=2721166 RepID=UPI0018660B82|nr:hypothetical protein [Nostoc sp. MG11]